MTGPGMPPFSRQLRGYARAEVDEHLARTARELEQARAALHRLEQQQARALEQDTRTIETAEWTAHGPDAERTVPLAELRDPEATGRAEPLRTGPSGPLADAGSTARPPLPHPRPPGPTRRPGRRRLRAALGVSVAVVLVAVVLVAGAALLAQGRDGPARERLAGPSAPSPPASAAPRSVARATPARPAPAPAVVPAGWTAFRSPDGLWSIALPPGWRPVGAGPTLRFLSRSGLSAMSVRTAPVARGKATEQLAAYERALATQRPGYRRLSSGATRFRGRPAGLWDYTYTTAGQRRRASDLGVVVDGRGYLLHVESRGSWRFARPLVKGFRASFTPR